jgi:hypothetical protein
MKYKLYRAKNHSQLTTIVELKNFIFGGEFNAPLKSDVNFLLAKKSKTDENARPIMVGDVLVDSTNKAFIFTNLLLWMEIPLKMENINA